MNIYSFLHVLFIFHYWGIDFIHCFQRIFENEILKRLPHLDGEVALNFVFNLYAELLPFRNSVPIT